jgi:hypothetical protein
MDGSGLLDGRRMVIEARTRPLERERKQAGKRDATRPVAVPAATDAATTSLAASERTVEASTLPDTSSAPIPSVAVDLYFACNNSPNATPARAFTEPTDFPDAFPHRSFPTFGAACIRPAIARRMPRFAAPPQPTPRPRLDAPRPPRKLAPRHRGAPIT